MIQEKFAFWQMFCIFRENLLKMFKKYIIFAIFLLQSFIIQAQSWEKIREEKKGKMEINYFRSSPFVFEDSQGKVQGIEVELIYEMVAWIEKNYQVKLEVSFLKAKSFADMYAKTKNGKAGMFGISSISITDSRRKEVQFSPPYIADIEVLICSQDIPDVHSIEELVVILEGKTALYVPNTTYEQNLNRLIQEHSLKVRTQKVANSDEASARVQTEKGVFSFADLPRYLMASKDKKPIKRQNFFSVNRTGYALAFPLESDWNEPIDAFFQQSDYQIIIKNLLEKYLGSEVHELMVDMAKSDSLKRNMDIVLLMREKQLRDLEIKNKQLEIEEQKIIQNSLIVGVFLIALLIFLVYNRYRIAHKSNYLLTMKNLEIQTKSEEIAEKNLHLEEAFEQINKQNKDIYASIQYAKRIQDAMLPMDSRMRNALPDYFVFFQAKSLVSGDFYYFTEKNNLLILAASDCTGHGVPGALMSMLGTALLNEIVLTKNAFSPAYILEQLHKGIRNALKQNMTDSRDGMDIGILIFEKENTDKESKKIVRCDYAGAMNPLFYIQNKEMFEIKADKMPIGGREMGKERIYTNHQILLGGETIFYLYTDGFSDQIGGAEAKKLMTKNFKKLLFQIHSLPLETQKQRLENIFTDWKGQHKQVDDVLVMGIKIFA